MSTKKWTNKSQSSIKENSKSLTDNIKESTVATHKKVLNTRTRHDVTTDNVMHNAAKLLGKISLGVLPNSDGNTTDQETRTNVRRNNFASAMQKEQLAWWWR